MTMRIFLFALFSIVVVLGLHFSGVVDLGLNRPDEELSVFVPQPSPDVVFTKTDGTEIPLRDLKGKVVFLNFWATWCGPCFDEFPSLLDLVEAFNGQLVLIAVSNDSDPKEIDKFIRLFPPKVQKQFYNQNIHLVWDKNSEISRKNFGVFRFPETLILNPQQKMVQKIVGPTDWVDPTMQETLRNLLLL